MKQSGIPAGAPRGISEAQAIAQYTDHLKRTAALSQQAYNAFARLILDIQAKGFKMDPSKAANVLVAEDGFHLVDINPTTTYSHGISDILLPLLDNGFVLNTIKVANLTEEQKHSSAKLLLKFSRQHKTPVFRLLLTAGLKRNIHFLGIHLPPPLSQPNPPQLVALPQLPQRPQAP